VCRVQSAVMGVTETDLLEEMDLHSVECLNQVG
jgi:hypothetical protein